MDYELKAEYEYRDVRAWHVVPTGTTAALCGQLIAPAAETQALTRLDDLPEVCPRCMLLYRIPG